MLTERGTLQILSSDISFPKTSDKWHFSEEFYMKKLRHREGIQRNWLIYSTEADVIFCFCYKFYGSMPGNQWSSSVSKIISRLLSKHRNHLQDNVNRPSYNGNRKVKFFKTEKGLRTEDNYGQGMMDGLALLYIKKGASNID